jgi:hypothetical protein
LEGDALANAIEDVVFFVQKHFEDQVGEVDSLQSSGEIHFEHLWNLFPPICEAVGQSKIPSEIQAHKVVQTSYVHHFGGHHFELEAKHISYDGKILSWKHINIIIPGSEGARVISLLPSMPLKFYPQINDLRRSLIS